MGEDINLPEPVAYRWRVGEHPWYFIAEPLSPRPLMETQALYTADQLRSAVEADRAQRVPDGWKLVPVNADFDQLRAGESAWHNWSNDSCITTEVKFQRVYRAMLAAAPVLAAAPAAPQHREPAQQPLTDEQLLDGLSAIGVTVWGQRSEDFEAGVRFAERMHGIGEKMP